MDIESSSSTIDQKKGAGVFACGWDRLQSFSKKIKEKTINVGKNTKKLAQDDPRRIIHSLKVGLALTFVSLMYYWRRLYDGFGISGIWAVITVVVIMEFTVGATLSKGLNRGFATLLAGALGIGAQKMATLCGHKVEPIVLGFLVFLLAAAATFSRFFPGIKARYDYGVLIFILTFSMVSVSGYRVDELVNMAQERLSTILIGFAICLVVSIFVCPVWAGETLHNSVASSLEQLSTYLEGFSREHFRCCEDGDQCVNGVSKDDKSFLQGYKTVLNSKANEESMANLARWEPKHGSFRFRHPWKQYLKIGALARQCAYQIEALNSYISSDIQAPPQFRRMIQEPCTKMSSESGKALKVLSSAIKTMTNPSSANPHVENAKTAINELKNSLKNFPTLQESSSSSSDLLGIVPAASVASILVEIVKCVENISQSVSELSELANFKDISVEPTVSPEKPQLLLHRGTVKPVLSDSTADDDDSHVVIKIAAVIKSHDHQGKKEQLSSNSLVNIV